MSIVTYGYGCGLVSTYGYGGYGGFFDTDACASLVLLQNGEAILLLGKDPDQALELHPDAEIILDLSDKCN